MDMETQPPLFEHQSECISEASKELSIADRCKIIMACGTGKTRIGSELALSVKANTVVVYLPSLALVRQTLPEWIKAPFNGGIDFLCVCSDATVAVPFTDDVQVTIDELVEDLGMERKNVTTDVKVINTFLNQSSQSVRVIFCTYQSCDTLRDGLSDGFIFDFGLFDEAHKTAGRNVAFSAPLNDSHTPIKKRVFMTATPKHFDIRKHDKAGDAKLAYSMDDEMSYGRTAFNLPIRKAIELGVIAGYQVLVSVIDDKTIAKTLRDKTIGDAQHEAIAHAIAIKNAMDEYNLKKAVTFHDTVENAAFFAEHELIRQELGIDTFHVSGQLNSKERSTIMENFASVERGLVTNAKCLTEGVDVPAIDLVAFLHPKKSQIDIIQAIGRALRRPIGSDKTMGYILLPLYVSDADNGGLERALQEYGYDTIFQVIQALREQDEIVDAALTQFKIDRVQNKGDRKFTLDFITTSWAGYQVKVLRDVITTRIVDTLVESWYTYYALLQQIYEKTGDANIVNYLEVNGLKLGYWLSNQRAYLTKGKLLESRKSLLDKLNVSWNPKDDYWVNHFKASEAYFSQYGHIVLPKSFIFNGYNIGRWLASQRISYSEGVVSQNCIEMLESIGMVWNKYDELFEKGINAFIKMKALDLKEVPKDLVIDNINMTNWVGVQRKNYRSNLISKDRVMRLEKLGFAWNAYEKKFQSNFQLLSNYFKENGNTNVPLRYVIDGVRLGAWCQDVRERYIDGKLHKDKITKFNELNFVWDVLEYQWNDRFYLYKQHLIEKKPLTSPLRQWLSKQRKDYKLNKLSKERLDRLESIGVVF